MHAVIRTGGKQYRVAAQDVIRIEKVAGDEGDVVVFDEVLAVDGDIGAPLVSGASVAGRVVAQARAEKIIVFKKKRRQGYRRKKGHRQDQTIIRIEEILTGGKKASTAKKPAAKKDAPKQDAPKQDAPKQDAPKQDAADQEARSAEKQDAARKEAPKKDDAKADAKPAAKTDGKKTDDKKADGKKTGDAPMFKRPAGEPDDLKKISGVGPVIEKKLHALGIIKYAQIAAFTKAEIDQVDEVLNFKGRIERDDWVSQAKKLADGS